MPLRAREVACAVKLLRSEVCFASVLGQALLHFVRKHKTSRCRRHNFTWQSRTSPPIPAGRSYDTISWLPLLFVLGCLLDVLYGIILPRPKRFVLHPNRYSCAYVLLSASKYKNPECERVRDFTYYFFAFHENAFGIAGMDNREPGRGRGVLFSCVFPLFVIW